LKKALKIVAVLLGIAVLALAGFATYINADWPVKKPTGTIELKVEPTPARLQRGKALVGMRCALCHYDQETGGFTGHKMMDAPTEFGEMFSHNITAHPTKGLGRYTNGELAYLLRTGIERNGTFTGPLMASPFLGDEDLISIIAFLRSDDPWFKAQDVDDRQMKPGFLLKMLMHVAWKPAPVPTAPIPVPPLSDKVAYGRYVVHGLGDCFVCHSRSFKTLDPLHPEKSEGYMGGGNNLLDAAGNTIYGANLTMDATGLGSWTEDEFVHAVLHGVRKDGKILRYPMVIYNDLSEAEVRAVWAYLQTLPKIAYDVPRNWDAVKPPSTASEGEKLYYKYSCNSCHGTKGVGICDVRKASEHYPTDEKLSEFLHDAGKFVVDTKMPTWNGIIADSEFPAIISFIHKLEGKK
jgi:mono/diheme cytochrome c family protein